MAAALPPAYYTLSAPDLLGGPPKAPDVGRPLPCRPLSHPHPTVWAQQAQDLEQATPRYQTVHFSPPLRMPCAEEEKNIFLM